MKVIGSFMSHTPVLIEEQQTAAPARMSNLATLSRGGPVDAPEESIAPGTIPITASVRVSFQLVQDQGPE